MRVSLDGEPERWIAIKPKLGMGDRNRLLDVLVSIGSVTAAGRSEITAKAGAFQMELLQVSIVDWHLQDEQGADIPYDPALVRELDPDDPLVEKVADEVVLRNPFGKKS